MIGRKEIEIHVSEDCLRRWQELVDMVCRIAGTASALVMRVCREDIEVFVASKNAENPFEEGEKASLWGSGLYCEYVVKHRNPLCVVDARLEADWCENPDLERNMVSYLGYPIVLPSGGVFGTFCVLDHKANTFSEEIKFLMQQLRDLLQFQLAQVYLQQSLGDRNRYLQDYIEEIKFFRGFVTLCASCKGIRDSEGFWHALEDVLLKHRDTKFSHGICPKCVGHLYGDVGDEL